MKLKIFVILMISLITSINVIYLSNNEEMGIVAYGVGRITLLFVLVSIVYTVQNTKVILNSPRIIRITLALGIFSLIVTVLNITNIEITNLISKFSILLYWVASFMLAYIAVRTRNDIFNVIINIFSISLLIIAFYYFAVAIFFNYSNVNEYFALNQSNFILLLLPFVLLLRKNSFKLIGITIIAIAIFISLKRTGTIALFLSLGVYYFTFLIQKSNKIIRKKYIYLFILFSIVTLGLSFEYISSRTQGYLVYRLESSKSDEGSGRIGIWKDTYKVQLDSDLQGWIFGHGYNKVVDTSVGNSAHNDFQELLYDYGLIGFTLYLLLYQQLFIYIRKMYRMGSPLLFAFSASLTIFIILSSFSHLVIYPSYFIYLTFFWGAVIGQYENDYLRLTKTSQFNRLQNKRI